MKTVAYVERYNYKEDDWERLGIIKYDPNEEYENYVFFRTGWSGVEFYDMKEQSIGSLMYIIREEYGYGWDSYKHSNFDKVKA